MTKDAEWLEQRNDKAVKCNGCNRTITAWSLYWRLTYEPDNRDVNGRDFCTQCGPVVAQGGGQ